MPYNKTLSNRQQRPIKMTVAGDSSHPIQGPRSDRRGRHGLNGPRYRHARSVSLEHTSASSVSPPNPFRSYFHVESISAAGIERLASESTSTTTIRRTSSIRRSTISSVKARCEFDRCLELELCERLTDCQHETCSCGIELANLFCHPTAFASAVGTTSAPPDSPPAPVDASRDPGLDPTNITDDPSLDKVKDITPNVEPAIDVPVLPAVAPTVSFASDGQGGFRFGLSQLASMLSPTRRTVPTTTAEMPQPAFSKKSPVLAKPRPLPLGLTPSPGVSPISTGEPACNVLRHTGSVLIASSNHTGRTVSEHGNSERTVLITVNKIAINHGSLPGRHGGNRHCVGFRLARRRCNGIWNKGGEVNQSTLKETNMTTGGTGSITITKRGITKLNKAGVNCSVTSFLEHFGDGQLGDIAKISQSLW